MEPVSMYEGRRVQARLVGAEEPAGIPGRWAIARDELPAITTVEGSLAAVWLDEFSCYAYSVNGWPVDESTITPTVS